MMLALTMDLVLMLLLALTSIWCGLVHVRLRRLRCDRQEIKEFIGALTTATLRAETAVISLKDAGKHAEKRLLRQQESVRSRSDELAHMLEAAHKALRRLENRTQGTGPMERQSGKLTPRVSLEKADSDDRSLQAMAEEKMTELLRVTGKRRDATKDDPSQQNVPKSELFAALQALK